jgi:hypothetical protein
MDHVTAIHPVRRDARFVRFEIIERRSEMVKQIMARSRPRKREPGHDPADMWAIEYARLRDRGYSHADAARLATLHSQDVPE